MKTCTRCGITRLHCFRADLGAGAAPNRYQWECWACCTWFFTSTP